MGQGSALSYLGIGEYACRRFILPTLAAVLASVCTGYAAESGPRISPEQVHRWIEQLNDDDFGVRETAAIRLSHAGPSAIAALAEGITSINPEVSWRASEVLRRMAMEGDEATMDRIVATLNDLAKRGQPGLAKFAGQMRERQRTFRQSRALAELRKHGGRVTTAYGEDMEAEGDLIAADEIALDFDGGGLMEEMVEAVEFEALDAPLLEIPELEIEDEGPPDPPAVGKIAEALLPGKIGAAIRRALGGVEAKIADALPPIIRVGEPIVPDFGIPELDDVAEADDIFPADDAEEMDEPAVEVGDVDLIAEAPVIMFGGMGMAMDVEGGGGALWLSREWRGGDDGLKLAKDLSSVATLQIDSAEIGDGALAHFAKMPGLRHMQIRGGKFSREALRAFHRAKPEVAIMALGEGMMGVNGPFTGECQLNTVFPGSAANEAGIAPGDTITKIEGDEIRDFSELTIAVSTRKPGDKLKVIYNRNGEELETVLTLKQRGEDSRTGTLARLVARRAGVPILHFGLPFALLRRLTHFPQHANHGRGVNPHVPRAGRGEQLRIETLVGFHNQRAAWRRGGDHVATRSTISAVRET